MDPTIKNRLAAVVATEGWAAAETWLAEHHPGASMATYRERIRAEFADESRASLIAAVVSLAGPVVAVASYYLFAKGLQAISGMMAYAMILILGGLIGLGILGSWQPLRRVRGSWFLVPGGALRAGVRGRQPPYQEPRTHYQGHSTTDDARRSPG